MSPKLETFRSINLHVATIFFFFFVSREVNNLDRDVVWPPLQNAALDTHGLRHRDWVGAFSSNDPCYHGRQKKVAQLETRSDTVMHRFFGSPAHKPEFRRNSRGQSCGTAKQPAGMVPRPQRVASEEVGETVRCDTIVWLGVSTPSLRFVWSSKLQGTCLVAQLVAGVVMAVTYPTTLGGTWGKGGKMGDLVYTVLRLVNFEEC